MEELDEDIGNFVWDNIRTLDNLFPSKVYQKLLLLKQENEKLNFIDDLELIFDMNDEILENIKKEFFIDISNYTIQEMTELLKKYPSAHYIKKAEKLVDMNNLSDDMVILLYFIAYSYQRNSKYDNNILKFYEKALKICLKKPKIGLLREIYEEIGFFYKDIANYEKSLEYLNKVLEISISSKDEMHSFATMDRIKKVKTKILLSKKNKLNKIKIKNFKLLIDFEIEFSENINIIIGENSSGKTSLLQAITLGLLEKNYIGEINDYEKYITKSKSEAEIKLFTNEYEKTVILKNNKREINKNLYPFVLSYGSNFFTSDKIKVDEIVADIIDESIERDFTTSLFNDYTDIFADPITILQFIDIEENQRDETFSNIRETLINTINHFLDAFELTEKNKKYFFKKDNLELKLKDLSEGYRSNILLITDIVVKILGVGGNPDTVNGVILIDEFDKHLHPKWQNNLVGKLKYKFPKIQFILTTHNPMSILDRNPDEITIIKKTDEGKLIAIKDIGTKNIDVGTVLLKYFGVDSLVGKEMREKINELTALKLKGDLSEKEFEKLDELEDYFEYTPATNFIYNQAYFNFLIFLKNNENIDFRDYEKMKDKEMVKLMEKFKDLF